jgi:TP901-1 family phage major tail protein
MAQKDGLRVLLNIGGSIYAGQTTAAFSASRDEIDVTTKDSVEQWKDFLMGEKEATISIDGIQAVDAANSAFTKIFTDFNDNTPLAFILGGATAGDQVLTGNGYVQAFDANMNKNEGEGYSATIRVTGKITVATLPITS